MGKNKLTYIITFIVILFITGCNNVIKPNDNFNINDININETVNNDIVLKTGYIADNINIIGVKDDDTFYCFKGNNRKNIYLYHASDSSTSPFITVISDNKFIKSCKFNENWVVWVEDEVEIEGDNIANELNWATYAQNLRTGSIIEVDKYKEIILDSDTFFRALEPRELSIYGDNIVYTNYDLLENGTTIQAIKMFNLLKKEMLIIDSTKNFQNHFYSNPVIYGDYITWSQSTVDLKDNTEKGNTYIYDLVKKEKQVITRTDDILWPYISEDYIAARVKPNGLNDNTSITLYDKNTNDWTTIVSANSSFYKDNKAHVEMGMVVLSGHYLIWRDNVNANVIVYDLLNKKFYLLAAKNGLTERAIPIGLFNNVIFWAEDETENPQKQIILVKYALLK